MVARCATVADVRHAAMSAMSFRAIRSSAALFRARSCSQVELLKQKFEGFQRFKKMLDDKHTHHEHDLSDK
jgi:hypothetical protein